MDILGTRGFPRLHGLLSFYHGNVFSAFVLFLSPYNMSVSLKTGL